MIEFIQSNVQLAPFIIFSLLLLAGFNIPVSEDLMIILSASIAIKNPEYVFPLYFGVYAGAYCSDLICYTIGRLIGPKIWDISTQANAKMESTSIPKPIKFIVSKFLLMLSKIAAKESVDKISNFYKKYGIFTLIFGRFIPFGVRNTLFFSAGMGKMNFYKFALSDLVACTLSSSLLFSMIYIYGETVYKDYFKPVSYAFFGSFILIIVYILIKRVKKSK
jgi:membrane-associated protein